jgi:hypothetical protein
MKLKLIVIFSIFSGFVFSQEWAPVGAEWYYDISYTYPGYDYHRIYCDTIMEIKGIDCKRINIDYCACNNHFCDKLYTYDSNDTVFFYNSDIDTFQILYDFSATPGDSWIINPKYHPEKTDSVIVYVDSVGYEYLNGYNLKRLYVTYTYIDFWGEDEMGDLIEKSFITEVLGDNNLIINITDPSIGLCDMQFIHSLRCYEDSNFGFYSTNLRDSCTYSSFRTTLEMITDHQIKIYPNPAASYLIIDIDMNIDFKFEMYNSVGQLVKADSRQRVDLDNFPSGLYLIRIFDGERLLMTKEIIKHLP